MKELRRRIAHHVARLRAARGMTLEQLEERSGISSRQIQRIEAGIANPTLRTIVILADALAVEPVKLVAALPRASAERERLGGA